MTVQMAELFEHEGKTHTIIGMQGGRFIPLRDVIVELPGDAYSTNLHRGYQGTFAVDEQSRLILKTVGYHGSPETRFRMQEKQANQFIPITGHILFGEYHRPEWLVEHCAEFTNPDDLKMFEAEIAEGRVLTIHHCGRGIIERINALPVKAAPRYAQGDDYKQYRLAHWDWITSFLPRRYELLRLPVDYFDFALFLR